MASHDGRVHSQTFDNIDMQESTHEPHANVRLFQGPGGPLARPAVEAVTPGVAQHGHAEQGRIHSHRGMGAVPEPPGHYSVVPSRAATPVRGGRARADSAGGRARSRSADKRPDPTLAFEQRIRRCETWIQSFEEMSSSMPAVKALQEEAQRVAEQVHRLEHQVQQGDAALTHQLKCQVEIDKKFDAQANNLDGRLSVIENQHGPLASRLQAAEELASAMRNDLTCSEVCC